MNTKEAQILRYYHYKTTQAEQQLSLSRKAIQQLRDQQNILQQRKAELHQAGQALAVSFAATLPCTALSLDTVRRQLADIQSDAEQADDAIRCHALVIEAAMIQLTEDQRRLQRIDYKQQQVRRRFTV